MHLPKEFTLSQWISDRNRLQSDSDFKTQFDEEGKRYVDEVNKILVNFPAFQVHKDDHNQHCQQHLEQLTMLLFLPKYKSNIKIYNEAPNYNSWVVYEENNRNSHFIDCDANGNVSSKYNVLNKKHFQENKNEYNPPHNVHAGINDIFKGREDEDILNNQLHIFSADHDSNFDVIEYLSSHDIQISHSGSI